MRRFTALLAAALLVSAFAAPAASAATTGDSPAYTGEYVSFEVANDSIVDYSLNNTTLLESVTLQSADAADVGDDLAAAEFSGTPLSIGAGAKTAATVSAESGAGIRAHDVPRGTMVVAATENAQYVRAALPETANATAESDSRVSVTTNGVEGAFIVVGNGTVTVNDAGGVTASLAEGSHLVFRAYSGAASGADQVEQMIAGGAMTASAYLVEEGNATAASVVYYDSNTTVNFPETSGGTIEMLVERSVEEGAVVLVSVPADALGAAENISVTVDGEAATEASSLGALRESTGEANETAYLVRDVGGPRKQVYVAFANFSEGRQVQIQSNVVLDDETESAGDATDPAPDGTEESDSGGVPGFGVGVALVALVAAALAARAR